MNNMDVWNQVKQPPQSALKTIKGGRISGMTDINPQWRYQVMTELFGIAGIGWGYEIKRLWNEPASDGQVFAFAEIDLWIRGSTNVIPGIGGSMLITKESSGLHASDEGYKMAVTDALSVAMKMLGIGADIYAGLYDGSKYQKESPLVKEAIKQGATVKEHWCKEHNAEFFMKGKMKSFAHPIEGSEDAEGKKQWCYEHKNEPEKAEASQTYSNITLGSIRSVLAAKGYKTETTQKNAMQITDWKEITDLEGAMKWANDMPEGGA